MSYAASARIVFDDMLAMLGQLIAKAQAAGLPDAVLSERLADDMFPLELQFRVALNQVLLALNQVAGRAIPLEAATYRSLAEIRERIAQVREHVAEAAAEDWATPDATVDLTLPNGMRFVMTAEQDIRDWLLPNFYFHATMAYALLRRAGLPLGKFDFLRHMERYKLGATSDT